MKSVKVPALAALLGAALFLAPLQGPVALIKIPKVPGPVEPRLAALRVDVRQELGTCYLALAGGRDQTRLRQAKIRFTVLDPSAGRREIAVVRVGSASDLEALRGAGKAVAVESGAAAFWTDEGGPAGAVPSGLSRKVLPERAIKLRWGPAAAPRRAGPSAAVLDPVVDAIVALVSTANLSSTVLV